MSSSTSNHLYMRQFIEGYNQSIFTITYLINKNMNTEISATMRKLKDLQNMNAPASLEKVRNSDPRKTISNLEKMYKQEKQKRRELEEQILMYKKRIVLIEKQFNSVIEKYKSSLISSQNQVFHQDLERVYKQILINFDESNEATQEFIEKKYKHSHDYMQRKINEIVENMTDEVKKHSKISKQSHDAINREIKLVLESSVAIQEKNNNLTEKVRSLEFSRKVLKEERDLLVNELIKKKKKISTLSGQIDFYESESFANGRSQSDFSEGHKFPQRVNFPKGVSMEVYKSSVQDTRRNKISNSRPNSPMTPQFFGIYQSKEEHSKPKTFHPPKTSFQKNRMALDLNSSRKPSLSKQYGAYSVMQIASKQFKCECGFQRESYEKTIEHLNKSIRRSKGKIYQLQKILNITQAQNKEINDALKQAIQESYEKLQQQQNAQSDRLQYILESQKLIETLKMLKNRLSRVQNPIVSCGWVSQNQTNDHDLRPQCQS